MTIDVPMECVFISRGEQGTKEGEGVRHHCEFICVEIGKGVGRCQTLLGCRF